jgi:recombinational DNA repair ATPase RecF
MRLASLEVENFKGVDHARLELGPGLNVLYGPNELGKSTLAEAIRAVLLLPPKSTHQQAYQPWHSDLRPEVTITLQDDEGNYHRAFKRFGSDTAQLKFSKDQLDWTPNGKNRQVDENLRELLNWGLPGRGGKARIQGLPDTYLVAALLAPQDEPGKIFSADFNKDYADDGKQLLTDALQALAEDPDFKRIMERTRAKVSEVFSETGRERVIADSPFVRVANELKVIAKKCEKLRENVSKCGFWQSERDELRDSLPAAKSALDAAAAKLAHLESQADIRKQLAIALTHAIAARDAATAAQVAVAEAEAACKSQSSAVADAKAKHEAAQSTESQAREVLAAAQAKLQQLSSDQAAAQRQLAAANARSKLDGHRLARVDLKRIEDRVGAAAKLAAACRGARDNQQRNTRERERLEGVRKTQENELQAAQARLADARRKLTWHDKAEAERRVASLQAERKRRSALESRLTEFAKTLAEKQASALLKEAPDADTLETLRTLQQDLAVARKGLEMGLSVEISPIIPFSGSLCIDGQPGEATRFESKQFFEANMDVAVNIDNLGSIAVRAGGAGTRERFDLLSARWQQEAEPVLSKAKVKSMEALHAVFQRAVTLRSDIATLQRDIATVQEDLAALADPTLQLVDAQAHLATFADDLPTSEQTRAQLEQVARLADSAITEQQRDLGTTRSELARLQAGSEHDSAEATKAEAALADLEAELGAPWQVVQQRTNSEIAALNAKIADGEKALQALNTSGDTDLSAAKSATTAAQKVLEQAETASAAAATALEAARAKFTELERECGFRKGQAATRDLAACEAAVSDAQAKLVALGDGGAEAVAEQRQIVLQQRRLLEDKRAKIAELQGLLGEYGNDIVNERLQRCEEALALKEKEEKRIRADYAAWQKLEETLIQVHQEQAAHLGNKLAGGVSEHFRELTGSDFERLLLGPNLEFEGLRAAGGKRELGELSVGAQEQLAAVLRLALARHLGMMVMLDDHLVHSDAERLDWLNARLRTAAETSQIIVWTCHPDHYLSAEEMASPEAPVRDSGDLRAIDLSALIQRAS